MNKNAQKVKAARIKAEEEALNRILYWMAGGAVLEFLLLLLNRYWSHYGPATIDIHMVLVDIIRPVGAGFLMLAVVGGFLWRRAAAAQKPAALPITLCLMSLGLGMGCLAAYYFGEPGILLLCYLTLSVALLAIIFHLYQREFFLLGAQGAVALMGVWVCDKGLVSMKAALCYVYVIGAVALVAAAAFLCRRVQLGKGVLEWKEKKLRLLAKDANYNLLYGGAAVAVLVMVGALLALPSMVLSAVEVAWLCVMAVYYTVKLM